MASIWKRIADRKRKDRPYLITYNDEHGRRRTVPGCTDHAATQEIANKLEADAKLRLRGLIDPNKARCAKQSNRVMAVHIAEFVEYLQAEGGKSPRYIQTSTCSS